MYSYVFNNPGIYFDPTGEKLNKECLKALIDAILALAYEVLKRYWDLLFDKNNLFYNKPSGQMSWVGHQQQMREKQNRLKKLLDEVKKKCKDKCDDDDDNGPDLGFAEMVARLPIPQSPWPKQLSPPKSTP